MNKRIVLLVILMAGVIPPAVEAQSHGQQGGASQGSRSAKMRQFLKKHPKLAKQLRSRHQGQQGQQGQN